MKRGLLHFVVIALLPGFAIAAVPERDAKAAFIFHLTQFVTWPRDGGDVFKIGILGPDPFGQAIDEIVYGERVGARRIQVKRSNMASRLTDCDLVYLSPRARERTAIALSPFAGKPILTVGESDDFLIEGGMIQLTRTPDRKIRLRVSLDRVKQGDLKMSAQLLRVCEVISGGGS